MDCHVLDPRQSKSYIFRLFFIMFLFSCPIDVLKVLSVHLFFDLPASLQGCVFLLCMLKVCFSA